MGKCGRDFIGLGGGGCEHGDELSGHEINFGSKK
jgi:hypothetical protein